MEPCNCPSEESCRDPKAENCRRKRDDDGWFASLAIGIADASSAVLDSADTVIETVVDVATSVDIDL